ncbi:MAG: patatin-like phospholipase family protein [Gemmataceae bacterium]
MTDQNRILSLDGGGSLGLIYLPILECLEADCFDGTCLKDTGEFSMFIGTSTGAIVSVALKLGMPAKDIKSLYEKCLRQIFKGTSWWNSPLFFKYDAYILRDILAEELKKFAGGQDLTWRDLNHSDDEPDLVVMVRNESHGRVAFLSTNPTYKEHLYHDDGLEGALLADIVTACCSAPYYFAPRAFYKHQGEANENPKGDLYGIYCDGGVTGLVNPAAFGVALLRMTPNRNKEAIEQTEWPIQVVSLSCGEHHYTIDVEERSDWIFTDTIGNAMSALMGSSSELMHQFHSVFARPIKITKYLRTTTMLDKDVHLDDLEHLDDHKQAFSDGKVLYEFLDIEKTERNVLRSKDQPLQQLPSMTTELLKQLCTEHFGMSTQQRESKEQQFTGTTPSLVAKEVRGSLLKRLSIGTIWKFKFWLVGLVAALLVGLAIFSVVTWKQSQQLVDTLDEKEAALKEAEDLATTLINAQYDQYITPTSKLSILATPPLKSGFPFQNKEENKKRSLSLGNYVLKEAPVPPTEGIERQKLYKLAEVIPKGFADWEAKIDQPPPANLRNSIESALLLYRSLWRNQGKKRIQKLDLANLEKRITEKKLNAYQRVFAKRRKKGYQDAKKVIETFLAAPKEGAFEGEDGKKVRKAYLDFYELYYGRLLIVEDRAVEGFMALLGQPKFSPLSKWTKSGIKPDRFTTQPGKVDPETIQKLVIDGQVEEKMPRGVTAVDFIAYLDYQIDRITKALEATK